MAIKENAPAGTEAGYFKTRSHRIICVFLVNIGVVILALLAWAGCL